MNELIETIESSIPHDWVWLVRRLPERGCYFANICEGGIATVGDPAFRAHRAEGRTPEQALRKALASYRGTLS